LKAAVCWVGQSWGAVTAAVWLVVAVALCAERSTDAIAAWQGACEHAVGVLNMLIWSSAVAAGRSQQCVSTGAVL
jgi:hypothetical protein